MNKIKPVTKDNKTYQTTEEKLEVIRLKINEIIKYLEGKNENSKI